MKKQDVSRFLLTFSASLLTDSRLSEEHQMQAEPLAGFRDAIERLLRRAWRWWS